MLDKGIIEKRREFIINFFYIGIIVALLAFILKFTFLWFVFVSIPRIVVGITIYKNCHELKIQFKTN